VPPEVAPAIHFREQIGDLDPWHKPIGLTGQQLRFIRLLIVERRDLQDAVRTPSRFASVRCAATNSRSARVSTHDQQTLPMQLSAMRSYARTRGWTVAVEVKDVGLRCDSSPFERKTDRNRAAAGD
jgi:hypothetical protein